MHNRSIYIITFAFACLLLTSCEKTGLLTFHAKFQEYEVQGSSKVHMSGLSPVWDNGDQVKVNGQTETVTSTGSLTIESTSASEVGYCMVYPASIVAGYHTIDSSTIVIPPTQLYEENGSGDQKIKAPMAAKATRVGEVKFYNIGALIAVNVTNNTGLNIRVRSVKVSNSPKLHGTFPLKHDGTRYVLGNATSHGNYVTLDCSQVLPEIADGTSKVFYVSVPKINNITNVKVSIDAIDYKGRELYLELTNPNSLTVKVGQVTPPVPTELSTANLTGLLYGKFSVSGSTTVQFTPGCLLYNGSSYSIAASQGAVLTNANSASGTRDLLLGNWGPCLTGGTMSVGSLSGLKCLSQTQWNYLLNSRGDNSTPRFKMAKITDEGVNRIGIILFPDDFVIPAGVSLGNINDNSIGSVYDYFSQWEALQANGAVFIPIGGQGVYINGSYDRISSSGSGFLWLSSDDGDYKYMSFKSSEVRFANNRPVGNNAYGCLIRLVK